MKFIFQHILFFLLCTSAASAQNEVNFDINSITENTNQGCLSGNCSGGEGVFFNNAGYLNMRLFVGTLYKNSLTGEGAIYELRPYGLTNKVRVLNIRRGLIDYKLLLRGSYTVLSLRSGDTLETSIGTFNDEYFKPITLIKGLHFFYPMGKSSSQYIKEEGYFANNDSFNVTVTTHGLITIPDYSFTIKKFDLLNNYCVSGDCSNGQGVSLSERGIYTGEFKNNSFVSGTIEFFNTPINDGAGLYTTKDGVHGIFTPAGSDDLLYGTLDLSKKDYNIEINYKDYAAGGSKRKKISKYTQNWLTSVYMPFDIFEQRVNNTLATYNREEEYKKQAEYEKDHPYTRQAMKPYSKETDPFYFSPDEQRQRGLSGQSSNSSSHRSSYSSFSSCSVCGGVGYTTYDCGQGGGHPCRKYCTACNGTGSTHN